MSKPPIDLQTQPKSDFRAALTRVGTIVVLGILPIAALVTMFVVGVTGGPLSGDFHYELYPQAKILLHGDNPGAVGLARLIRSELISAGVRIAPLAEVMDARKKAA